MMKRNLHHLCGVLGLIALAVSLSGCGGGGGNATPTPTNSVALEIRNAQWVAFQDGANGAWRTLSPSGGFNGTVNVTAADGRYSVAYVCGGDKPTVHIVHATRAELPQFAATCGASPTTIQVDGTVQGLNGSQAIVAIGEFVTATAGNYTLSVVPGSYDVIAVRIAGNTPNRIWLQRNRTFDTSTLYNIDFSQPDGQLVRVFDVSSGAASVSGIDTGANETVTGEVFFLSGARSSIVSVGNTITDGAFLNYPLIPSSVLNAGEGFRLKLSSNAGRGVEEVVATLPSSLNYTLPAPFSTALFTTPPSGPVAITATNLNYPDSPVRGYQMNLSADAQPVRYRVFFSSAWLSGASSYTTPVLSNLAGWNSIWSLQRGASIDVGLQVLVSPSATSEVLSAIQTGNPPIGFQLRYATRRGTVTP
ncbi:MAG: hypothetical protein ACK4ME_08025 [Fimbriimonadales bacterium]